MGTGIAALDGVLGGGWPGGALCELVGGRGAGRTSILYSTLADALAAGRTAALVDAAGALDPRAAEDAGIPLPRLLWIRAGACLAALRAADLLIAAGGFHLLGIDLGDRPSRVPHGAWIRLKHAAERQRTTVVVAATRRVVGATAAAAVELRAARPRFAAAGGPHTSLFLALETRATAVRTLGAAPPPANDQRLCFLARPR
jgi:protein ImuA